MNVDWKEVYYQDFDWELNKDMKIKAGSKAKCSSLFNSKCVNGSTLAYSVGFGSGPNFIIIKILKMVM